jgi:prevent-host-death family protein
MGIRELRDALTVVLRRVEGGERIEVTRDGEPVAVIAPYAPRGIDRLVAEGRATPGRPFEPRVPSLEWPLDRSTTEIVSEGREDRF